MNSANHSIVSTIEQLCSNEQLIDTPLTKIHKICIKHILRRTTLKGLSYLYKVAHYKHLIRAKEYLHKYIKIRKEEVKI